MTVSILGREYVIEERTSETDSLLEDMNGYCDPTIAIIVIDKQDKRKPDSVSDLASFKKKVTRHELIHAFLSESGLLEQCEWACEEMVDWVAIQFPKIAAAFDAAGCI